MSKEDIFADLDTSSDFTARKPVRSFRRELNPKEEGVTKLHSAHNIELSQIVERDQVRKSYAPDKHEEMVTSLRNNGQITPITVYWSEDEHKYVVFVGHRRFRAAKAAGLTSLMCITYAEEPEEATRIEIQLEENAKRDDLNALDEALAYKELIALRGCSARALSKQLGVSDRKIQQSLKILELPEDMQKEVAAGLLNKSVVREVLKVSSEIEQREIIEAYKQHGSLQQVAGKVQEKRAAAKPGAKGKTKKTHSTGGIKLQATANKKVTNAQVIEALEEWLGLLKSDRRGQRAA